MSDTLDRSAAADAAPPGPASPAPSVTEAGPAGRGLLWAGITGLLVLTVGSVVLAYQAHERVQRLEQELVRRQQDSQSLATEARALARQAQEVSMEASAKTALLEARLAEVALQRSQLDELMLSLSRSRDENLLADLEAGLRVALQQAAITGSAEPVVAALRSAEERLGRLNQPLLEGVRRAILRDLERISAVNIVDVSVLVMRLDEAIRLVDELPLQASPADRLPASDSPGAKTPRKEGAPSAPSPSIGQLAWWQEWGSLLWEELRGLVRVTRIDEPEAMLLAPEQGYFLRENLKLRLLNARLALLSRQFEAVQSDLELVKRSIQHYFDPRSRKTGTVQELVRQVAEQARRSSVPRPDDTLAALAAAATVGR